MKSKKAIIMLIAGGICFAAGAILSIWTENMWSYILCIPGFILINLAIRKETCKRVKEIDSLDNVNSLMKNLFYKPLIVVLTVVVVIAAAYLILPGLSKQSMVYIGDYTVSEDRQEMEIQVGVASSAGYVRKVEAYQIEGQLYLDFYSCFGGINSSIGAKNEFKVPLYEDTDEVLLCVGKDAYVIALEKDADGNWVRFEDVE